ncbi:MAG: hypothetical protein K6B45_04850 [Bacteroidaceae bacterium]|nr:hypothetical protein [Bacteroidaceae bacterium]
MTTAQSYIDQLIQAINDAVEAGSVTNVMVGTILDFLNRRSQELSEQVLTAEAVKFKNPVFLWGNQFDGSADVSGNLHFSQIVCSLIFGDNRHRLEVINLGTAEMPEYVLHSTLPFYSDSWVAGGGTGVDDGIEEEGDSPPDGVGGDRHYEHLQTEASSVWVIVHNLDKWPSVTIVDDAGNVVVGDVFYINKDTVRVVFNAEFSGRAYLN